MAITHHMLDHDDETVLAIVQRELANILNKVLWTSSLVND